MKLNKEKFRAELSQFTGTEKYHLLIMSRKFLATDGVAYMAKTAEAFWLITAIWSYQYKPEVKALGIQFWTLDVKDDSAVLYVQKDKGTPKIVEQKFEYTDFPEGVWNVWVQNNVAMLPSEY